MKQILRTVFHWKVLTLARLLLWRFRPGIVAVTGSVGKTSTKFAIAAVLSSHSRVRVSQGNFNTDIGIALTILGDFSEEKLRLISRDAPANTSVFGKAMFWKKVFLRAFVQLLFKKRDSYPEILILEYGIDRPGDMKALLQIAKPNVSVVTAIGDIPAHVEFFAGPAEVAREKMLLAQQLPLTGYAVVNGDDEVIMDHKDRVRAHLLTYGFGKNAQVRVSGFEHKIVNGIPEGIAFKLEYGGSFVPVRLSGALGRAQAYSAAAAAGVGITLGMNLVAIASGLERYHPAKRRMSLVPGIRSSTILDDGYNASPLSMLAALDTLESLPALRKIAILGDMLEIGKYAKEGHERVGEAVAQSANVLVTIGRNAAYIGDGAHREGLRKTNIHSFNTAEEAREFLKKFVKKGDLILVKASNAMHLERIVQDLRVRNEEATAPHEPEEEAEV